MTPVLKHGREENAKVAYYQPAVSIILPFEPKMGLKAELSYSLKIAADEVYRELKSQYPSEIVAMLMDKLEAIVNKLNFSTHKKSIAIFLSPVSERVLYMDIPVRRKIIVDDSFEIRDIVKNKKQLKQYLVLLLSGTQSKIFLGNSESLVKIVSNTARSAYAFVNDVAERVANFTDHSERKEILMEKFLHQIDNALGLILNAYPLPLYVMGTERIMGHFKQMTKHGGAVVEYIHGNYDDATSEVLLSKLREHTQEWERVREKDLMNQIDNAAGRKKLAVGIMEVWNQARQGKGRLLIVEEDYMCNTPQNAGRGAIYMPPKPYDKFSHVKDAVGDVIQRVLENGGDVEFVSKDRLDDYQHIALIRYY